MFCLLYILFDCYILHRIWLISSMNTNEHWVRADVRVCVWVVLNAVSILFDYLILFLPFLSLSLSRSVCLSLSLMYCIVLYCIVSAVHFNSDPFRWQFNRFNIRISVHIQFHILYVVFQAIIFVSLQARHSVSVRRRDICIFIFFPCTISYGWILDTC